MNTVHTRHGQFTVTREQKKTKPHAGQVTDHGGPQGRAALVHKQPAQEAVAENDEEQGISKQSIQTL